MGTYVRFLTDRVRGSNVDRDSLALLLAQGLSVERIAKRFGKHPSTVSYWMAKHGLAASNRAKHAARGGIGRERLEELVAAGMTIAEMAAELDLSKSTVRHWLRRHGLTTHNKRGPRHGAVTRAAKDAGLATITRSCTRHGETEFFLEGRGYYRCKRCRTEAVSRRRRKVKMILIGEAGGRCCVCGYEGYPGALGFHHLDPVDKRLSVSAQGAAVALQRLRVEAGKCVLLCANCHAEVEAGVTSVPVQLLGAALGL
jgi:transposase